jgi:hypothetical protein
VFTIKKVNTRFSCYVLLLFENRLSDNITSPLKCQNHKRAASVSVFGSIYNYKENMPKHNLGYIITSKTIDERLIDLKINYWKLIHMI